MQEFPLEDQCYVSFDPTSVSWSVCSDVSRGEETYGGLFCSQINLVFFYYVLIDAFVSIDVKGNVILQTACNKSTELVVAMAWFGQESIMMVGQVLYMWMNIRWTRSCSISHSICETQWWNVST